jgi:adenylate cyclase
MRRGIVILLGMVGDIRRTLRQSMRWVNRQPSLVATVRAARQVLPGDADFGDPLSTTGVSPARVLGRRAWQLSDGRLGVLAELSLAGLQVADWIGEDVRGVAAGEELSIVFTDLREFSPWALTAGHEESTRLLRSADAAITEAVENRDGLVVKRLGDGTMAVFPDCSQAVDAAFDAIHAVGRIEADGYDPLLRAGLHVGTPQRIGDDFIGVDVNVASRLCEAAPAGEVLISDPVRERIENDWNLASTDTHLRGVPSDLAIFQVKPAGA